MALVGQRRGARLPAGVPVTQPILRRRQASVERLVNRAGQVGAMRIASGDPTDDARAQVTVTARQLVVETTVLAGIGD